MERKLGPIGPNWSAHGQASWGSKGNTLGKIFLARLPLVELTFVIRVIIVSWLPCSYRVKNLVAALYIVLFPDNSEISTTP